MILDSRLERDGARIGHFPLCWLLLMHDSNYPWFVLVPDRDGAREIHDLSRADQIQLIDESSALARALEKAFSPDKLNIAALGNIVAQLHIHHIVRYKGDPAWPEPVWGKHPPVPYEPGGWAHRALALREALGPDMGFTVWNGI